MAIRSHPIRSSIVFSACRIIEAELGRKLPDDFEALMRQATLERYVHALRPVCHGDHGVCAGNDGAGFSGRQPLPAEPST
jgi:hypothetical protein